MALQTRGFRRVVYEAHQQIGEDVGSTSRLPPMAWTRCTRSRSTFIRATGFPTRHNVLLSGTGKRLGEISKCGALAGWDGRAYDQRAHLYHALYQHAVRRVCRANSANGSPAPMPAADGVCSYVRGMAVRRAVTCSSAATASLGHARLIDPAAPSPR